MPERIFAVRPGTGAAADALDVGIVGLPPDLPVGQGDDDMTGAIDLDRGDGQTLDPLDIAVIVAAHDAVRRPGRRVGLGEGGVARILAAPAEPRNGEVRNGQAEGGFLGGLDLLPVDGDDIARLGLAVERLDRGVEAGQPRRVIRDAAAFEQRLQRRTGGLGLGRRRHGKY